MAEITAVVVESPINPVQIQSKKKAKTERVWADDETEKLISFYEARNCLWDVGNIKYLNRDEKERAYAAIDLEFKKLSIGREEYKYKWKILRGQCMREKEGERKRKSGQGADEVYVSKWKWFQSVKENVSPTKGFDTMQGEDSSKPLAKKQKQTLKGNIEEKKLMLLNKAVNFLGAEPTQTVQTSFSEEEHFGMMVAKTLTRLGQRQKIIAKKRITDVLFELELEAVTEPLNNNVSLSEFNFQEQQQQFYPRPSQLASIFHS